MKITKQLLREMIKEELRDILIEENPLPGSNKDHWTPNLDGSLRDVMNSKNVREAIQQIYIALTDLGSKVHLNNAIEDYLRNRKQQ